ncbi:unnamed protein product [Hydatigera taeniaeformis]|uniref:CULLIN_2 domain-containing protein n=1 Tax=Hydatigena taeniaeformis TaxID=6205 RepID=A0A0R3WUN2_HYDTA|nr:unnamed protein product [Hydatigera taeniaeformis]
MPAELVNRLARMFQDIKVSHDLTREFQEKASNNNLLGSTEVVSVLVSIKILSSGTWLPRSLPKCAVALPPELEDFIPQSPNYASAFFHNFLPCEFCYPSCSSFRAVHSFPVGSRNLIVSA